MAVNRDEPGFTCECCSDFQWGLFPVNGSWPIRYRGKTYANVKELADLACPGLSRNAVRDRIKIGRCLREPAFSYNYKHEMRKMDHATPLQRLFDGWARKRWSITMPYRVDGVPRISKSVNCNADA